MTHIPPPNSGFVDELESLGAPCRRRRYRSRDGRRYYEWDSQHGEFEVYNKRGQHLGVQDVNGVFIKEAEKGRKIDV